MWKEYKETFDGVHASQRLKAEVLKMKREENARSKRRVPAAALVAAILVAALAGTALAVEYFGKVDITFNDNSTTGYSVLGPGGIIPADSLSEKVLALCADMEWNESSAELPFNSWSEAEEYLGLELADNALIDQWKYNGNSYKQITPTGEEKRQYTSCLMRISTDSKQHLPECIALHSTASRGNCYFINQSAYLFTDVAGEDMRTQISTHFQGDAAFQEYVTPGGLEVTICSDDIPDGIYNRVSYNAYFTKNNALFAVTVMGRDLEDQLELDQQYGRQYTELYDPFDTLLEILDAYK